MATQSQPPGPLQEYSAEAPAPDTPLRLYGWELPQLACCLCLSLPLLVLLTGDTCCPRLC